MSILIVISYLSAVVYGLAVTILAGYGVHSLWLLALFLRHRHDARRLADEEAARPLPADADLPRVLVQLPVFNERDVVVRLVEAIGRLDWPKDRLIIQLLDDSTDDSVAIGQVAIAALRATGFDAVSLHRHDRTGYKAGALEAGMNACDAPFIAIFDADFIPKPDFLRLAIKPLLGDPGLALVQGRWDHVNRDENVLTRAQALGIDGHFGIEQGARAWSGLAMNFNGTCGLWRRSAIEAGGGWEHDTLTEDMDLSYRVQLKGWRCTYRLDLAVPGEVPATLSAWRSQQFRWAKGSIQTACKLLPQVWRSAWSLHAKLCATLHMTHYLVHPLILISLIAAPPALLLARHVPSWMLMFGLLGFVVGAGAPILLYAVSQWVLAGRSGWKRLKVLPALAGIGTGIAISNTIAVWEALIGRQSAFIRTPKRGFGKGSYKASAASGVPELLCAGWACLGLYVGWCSEHRWVAPLMLIYVSGFAWVAWFSLRERIVAAAQDRDARSPLPILGPAGVAIVAATWFLSRIDGGPTANPAVFAMVGMCIAGLYVLGVMAVRRRVGGSFTLAWVGAVALAMQLVAPSFAPAPAADRSVLEGHQISAGQNPYLIAPSHPDAFSLVPDKVPESSYVRVLNAQRTSTSPPLALWSEALVAQAWGTPRGFQLVAAALQLVALALAMALVIRRHLPPAVVIAAAWHPIGPLFAVAGGHLEPLMSALLVLGLLLAGSGRRIAALLLTTLAALVKPIAAVALIPQLARQPWRWALLPFALATAVYLPFLAAGTGLIAGFAQSAASAHFHGPLEPAVRLLASLFLSTDLVQPVVIGVLATVFIAGAWWMCQRDDEETGLNPDRLAHLFVLLLVCLPTLNPWYMLPVVLLLPFTKSWGLIAWTAAAPLWWLHGVGADGAPSEIWWVTSLAHLPALSIVAWEAAGRPAPWKRDEELFSPA